MTLGVILYFCGFNWLVKINKIKVFQKLFLSSDFQSDKNCFKYFFNFLAAVFFFVNDLHAILNINLVDI